ncbi:MAG TPA: hypothetical protein VKZ85_13600 [Woeseiaceae bacterium]|nr:hypothetical protein [Woeseiaceae bacterium]
MLRHSLAIAALAGLVAFAPAAHGLGLDFGLNKDIRIAPGSETDGRSTVNGDIEVGRDAVVNGDLHTVNGGIDIEANARVRDAESVNGRIRVGEGATAGIVKSVNGAISVAGDAMVRQVDLVNGRIDIEPGVRVERGVSNVNGAIRIAGAEIGADLETVNGDVRLSEGAQVAGDLVVRKPRGFNADRRRLPEIVVGPGVRIDGEIVLEREVELYLSETAEVGGVRGVMSLGDAVRFSGEHP